jgi:hypothetical protein
MPMKRFHPGKLAVAIPAAAAMMLAAAVFLWGLEYKCSLYPAPSRLPHSVPVAKLLSERERPVKVQAVRITRPLLAITPAFLWWFCVVRLRIRHARLHAEPLRLPRLAGALQISALTHFSFRPPPSIAS